MGKVMTVKERNEEALALLTSTCQYISFMGFDFYEDKEAKEMFLHMSRILCKCSALIEHIIQEADSPEKKIEPVTLQLLDIKDELEKIVLILKNAPFFKHIPVAIAQYIKNYEKIIKELSDTDFA